ncbi:MAG: TRAP transporter large permease subunit [Pseudomonadota bacterium]
MRTTNRMERVERLGIVWTGWINSVGVVALAVMMFVTVFDVFLRYFLNRPITGSIEITSVLLVLTIAMGIPYAGARNQHITIDTLLTRLPAGMRFTLRHAVTLIGLLLCAVLVWRGFEYSMKLDRMNRITEVLRLPIAPFAFSVTVAFMLYGLVLVVDLIRNCQQGIDHRYTAVRWLLLGAVIVALFYGIAAMGRDFPWSISPLATGIIGMILLFLVFLSGLPVFTSFILVGFLGMCYLRGPNASLTIMGLTPFDTLSNYTLSVIPLFVLMGEFCFFSGIGRDLYDMGYTWVGSLPGGLAMGTVAACGGFAAVCGDSMATAVTMGTLAIPEMKRYKYNPRLAVGCVASGGTLGVLIPPSLAFILYALLSDQSIALLFIAGIIPGILLVSLFMLSIYVRALRDPRLGPPGPKTALREKLVSLKGVWATLVLFALVIGGMYAGIFTPTEGGGIGAFGALAIGLVRGRLNWTSIRASLMEAGKISAVCCSGLVGAQMFGYFLAQSKLPIMLAEFVAQMAVPAIVVLIAILVVYLLLGCLLPAIPMLILTVPIFYPVVMSMGFDPIWFGVIMVLMFEMAVITPPMGINVLALQSITREIPLEDMFRGVIPFLLVMILCVAILIIFPDIALFLPNLLGK